MEIMGPIDTGEAFIIVWRTLSIFAYTFFLLRLLGRRRLAHLTYTDLLLIIALGSAVGDVMIYDESTAHFAASIIAITVVAVFVKVLDRFSLTSHRLSAILEGSAKLVASNGAIIPGALTDVGMSEELFFSLLREKEVEDMSMVRKAFIEPDGELSVVLYRHHGKPAHSDTAGR